MKNFKYLLILLITANLFAQENNIYSIYNFNPVVITGSRIPTEFSNSSRNITVIDEQTIKEQNAESIENLLQNITDLEFKTRGPLGVQSDVSIRGASNEQTLILIDGMKISDPQTAHHSMNIPVNLDDIAQIEILKGNASKIYGPNALGGVINIITKNTEKSNGSLNLSGGEYGYKEVNFSYSKPINNFSNNFSISQKNSNGYIKNTDFDIRNVFYKAGLNTTIAKYNLSVGYQRKDFGANRFYTPSETERETTEQFLANLNTFVPTNWGHLSIKLSGRKNYDHFIIPQYLYTNKHTTKMYSAELNGFYNAENFIVNFGSDINFSEIAGKHMNHDRNYLGLYGEAIFSATEKLSFSPGMSAYYYEDWGMQLFPGIDIGYQLLEKIRLFSSVGRSFRVPSFTDLFYSGVANMGNADLKPETAISYEIGGKYHSEKFQSSLTIFQRNVTDMIEYVKDASVPEPKYIASNLPENKITGIELTFKYLLNFQLINSINLSYSYFENEYDYTEYNFKYKYMLNSLKQSYVITLNQRLPYNFNFNWNINYQERVHDNVNGRMLTNIQTSVPINKFVLNINISNLFNEQYNNFMDVPMPGRWVKIGIRYNF